MDIEQDPTIIPIMAYLLRLCLYLVLEQPIMELKQLRVTGPRIWNALPTYIKNEISFNVFLKNLKVHYISGYA